MLNSKKCDVPDIISITIIIIVVLIEAVLAETQQPAHSIVYRSSYHHATRTVFGGGRHAPVREFVADG